METAPNQTNADTQKEKQLEVQHKDEQKNVKTVTPDNDNGDPGPPSEKDSANKRQRP